MPKRYCFKKFVVLIFCFTVLFPPGLLLASNPAEVTDAKAASIGGNSHPEYKTVARLAGEATSVAKKYYENSDSVKI